MSQMSQRSTKRFSDAEQDPIRECAKGQKGGGRTRCGSDGRRGSDALTKVTSEDESRIGGLIRKPRVEDRQPEVESTSRRKKVGNLPAPKS